jgi:hypothetical protein
MKVYLQNFHFAKNWLLYKITGNNKTITPFYPATFTSGRKNADFVLSKEKQN